MARKYQNATPSGHTILVIDDSPDIVQSCRSLLEAEGHVVLTATDGPSGLEVAEREHPHLILVDYFMPGMTGEEVVRAIRSRDRLVQIILQTGYSGEKPARVMLRQLDIQGYHDKGAGAEQLLLWVDSALKAYRSALATEKHRMGLQYILDITPDLHRLQPVDELLQGLLWQVEGLVGAENCFLATYSSPELARVAASAAKAESLEGFVALADSTSERSQMEIRVGTGRFRAGLSTESLPDDERSLVHTAMESGGISFSGGVSVLPLRLGMQLLGAIFIDRRPGYERDRDLLEIFACQAAAAIQELERNSHVRGMGDKSGRAILVNECHGMNKAAVRQLLDTDGRVVALGPRRPVPRPSRLPGRQGGRPGLPHPRAPACRARLRSRR